METRDLQTLEKLEKELSLKELQIKSLLTITQAINDNVSSEGPVSYTHLTLPTICSV